MLKQKIIVLIQTVKVLTDCSGSSCTIETKNIKNCTYNNEKREGESTFTLEPGLFQYVLKSNNKSVNVNQIKSGDTTTTNYLDLKVSNFPVSYAAVDGLHDTLSLFMKI